MLTACTDSGAVQSDGARPEDATALDVSTAADGAVLDDVSTAPDAPAVDVPAPPDVVEPTCTGDPASAPSEWRGLRGVLPEFAHENAELSDLSRPHGLTGVAYGNGVFVAPASNALEPMIRWATSTDGMTWTARSQMVTAGNVTAVSPVRFVRGRFVFFTEQENNGGWSYTSTDGTTWTAAPVGPGRLFVDEIAASDALTVTVGRNADMRTSSDFSSWTTRTLGEGAYGILDVDYGRGRFVASINGGGQVYGSADGATWAPITGLTAGGGFRIAYGNGRWIAQAGNNNYRTSTDGMTFAPVMLAGTRPGGAAQFAGGRFLSAVIDFARMPPRRINFVASNDGSSWGAFGSFTGYELPSGASNITYGMGNALAYGRCRYVWAGVWVASQAVTPGQPLRASSYPLIIVADAPPQPAS